MRLYIMLHIYFGHAHETDAVYTHLKYVRCTFYLIPKCFKLQHTQTIAIIYAFTHTRN